MSKKFVYKEGVTKKYEVMKEAMKYLDTKNCHHLTSNSKYEFICHCINRVVNGKPLKFNDKSGIIAIIEDRLEGESTFNSWLSYKKGIPMRKQDEDQGRKLQYTRKCWMQSMYEEFKAKDE